MSNEPTTPEQTEAEKAAQRERLVAWLAEQLEPMEQRLGLPRGFTMSIDSEPSDWAFIIKLAVLAEALVTHALVRHLGNELVHDHISRLPNSTRLNLAFTLGVVRAEERDVLEALALTRNSFAHRVENLTRDLEDYYAAMPNEQWALSMNKLLSLRGENKLNASNRGFLGRGMFRYALFRLVVMQFVALSLREAHAEREAQRAVSGNA